MKTRISQTLFALALPLGLLPGATAQLPGANPSSLGGSTPSSTVNAPPRVVAAASVVTNVFRLPATVRLTGWATDDGKPRPPKLTTLWTLISGPTGASITNPKATNTPVTFTRTGTYRFRLTASDGKLSTSATSRVDVVLRPNTPPVVEAGPNRTVVLPNPPAEVLFYPPPTLRIPLLGQVTDDGNPAPPGKTSCAWSRVSGPAGVIFSRINSPVTDVTFTQAGTYVLQLRASDGALLSTDSLAVTVLAPPFGLIELRPQAARNCPFPGDELWAFNTSTQRTIGFTVRIYYDNLWTPDTTEDLTFSLRPGQSTFVTCTYNLTYPKYRVARVIAAWDIGTASLLGAPPTQDPGAPAE